MIMIGSRISMPLLLAVQLSFWFIPETGSLVPPSAQNQRGSNTTLEIGPNLPRNKTSTPTKSRSALRPVSKNAPTTSKSHKSYIVLLNDQVEVSEFVATLKQSWASGSAASSAASVSENQVGYLYEDVGFKGFSAQLDEQAFKSLSRSAGVQEIFPDTLVSVRPIDEVLSDALAVTGLAAEPTHNATVNAQGTSESYSQKGTAPWGLQRIDQRKTMSSRGGSSAQLVNYDYYYSQPAGEGVIVYILDTGARETHNDFGGRVKMAAQFGGYDLDDGNGHGTHCAGIVAGNRWGVAKKVQVQAIKVLADDGSGSTSDVIAGVQYTLQKYKESGYKPSVVSLSLGGDKNSALDRAVQGAINQGIHFVVAAGNSNTDACLSSPASVSGANIVSASDIKDNRASYASWGTCVDLFAPGTDISSAWFTGDDAVKRLSGTSMATPYVAGMIAAHLSRQNFTTQQMSDKLKRDATRDTIYLGPDGSDPSTTPNLLLYNSLQ